MASNLIHGRTVEYNFICCLCIQLQVSSCWHKIYRVLMSYTDFSTRYNFIVLSILLGAHLAMSKLRDCSP